MKLSHDEMKRLFQLVQNNDEQAFEVFYREISKSLLAYCLSFTRNDDTARDLFHTVMVAVLEHRHRFIGGNLMGWIFTIARNACRNWEQNHKRFVPIEETFDVADEDSQGLDNDETLLVNQAIMGLPVEFRVVVLLFYFGELTIEDIALQENISESLVKIRLFRARKRLAKILRKSLEDTL